MATLDWSSIDDEIFVGLCSDLLRALGYSVTPQGDGPDGGIDIIASQPLVYGFNDVQSFNWGVQCKFSKSVNRAVNDKEIYNIEAVLRSSRYAFAKLGGYMLMTNRRISQSLIEQLRGINDATQFRTSTVDGIRLTAQLNNHDNIIYKYFVNLKNIMYDSQNSTKILMHTIGRHSFVPTVDVAIRAQSSERPLVVKAILDTGITNTVISSEIAASLGHDLIRSLEASISTSTNESVYTARINPIYTDMSHLDVDCLLGMDVLQYMSILWEGPNRIFRLLGP